MNHLGIEDEEFIRGRVPMTKKEIRILSLVNARLTPKSIVYDIGAGTGSISIEAARIAHEGHVYALEKNADAVALIRANMANFAVKNITVINEEAPAGLDGLPQCDNIFIGGSGGHLSEIIDRAGALLRTGGRIVINCVSVQTLMQAIDYFRAHGSRYRYETVQVQVTRLQQVGPYDMAKAANPIYILTAYKWDREQAGFADMGEKAV